MYDWFVGHIAGNPLLASFCARVMMGVATLLGMLGFRFDRLLTQLELRGLPHLQLERIVPPWLHWMVPESSAGRFLVVGLFVVGLAIEHLARQVDLAGR